MRNLGRLFVIAVGLAVLAGCTTVHVAEGGDSQYVLKRQLNYWHVDVNKGVHDAYEATLDGLDDLDIMPTSKRVDDLSGLVKGYLADGQELRIALNSLGAEKTQLQIRVGTLGDRDRVVRIFSAIEKHL